MRTPEGTSPLKPAHPRSLYGNPRGSWLTILMRAYRFLVIAGLAGLTGFHLHAATYEVAQQHAQATDSGPGTPERPWKTLAKAAASVQPGDLVLIRGGIYREQVTIKGGGAAERPIRFQAAPGEWVVMTGADRMAGWTKVSDQSSIYTVPWPYRFNSYAKTMTHPGDEYHRLIGRCEQVFVNGYALRQVLSSNQLAPGAFFADVDKSALFAWDSASEDLNKTDVEASVRSEILRVEGAYVQICGLRFRYAANAAQHGAVLMAGQGGLLQDCVVESMNASGAAFLNQDIVVRRCTFRDNGQLGFGASRAHRLLLTECLVENNNIKNFSRGWEAGGNKLVLSRGAVLEKSRFLRNRGSGIWFDIGNEECTVSNCLIADNEDAGIFYEISYGLRAHDNVITGNGFASTAGAWGAQAGICLSSSPGCVIERNLLVGNREGFDFREQLRMTPAIEDTTERPVWNHDEIIRHNMIAYNRDAQIWGWFDLTDNRHWPGSPAPTGGRDSGETSAKRGPDSNAGQPIGLTLEQLHLKFVDNVYFANPSQGRFNWGPAWRKHRQYQDLAEFQAELSIDRGGRILEPPFANLLSRDFRMTKDGMESLKAEYPSGAVPGVALGMIPSPP